MAKTKDMILVELYDAEIVRMVTEHLTAKYRRKADLERKDAYNKEHLRKLAEKRGAIA